MLQKNFTFLPQFQPFQPENFGLLAVMEVKKGTFPPENLPPTFAFPPQFLSFPERRKGSKFEPCLESSLGNSATQAYLVVITNIS